MNERNPFSWLHERQLLKPIAIIGILLILIFVVFYAIYQQSSQEGPVLIPQPTTTSQTTVNNGNTFYISRDGSDGDGRSWQTAWNELDRVDWSEISPGATIEIDGGPRGMTYTTKLSIGLSGTRGAPITIMRATETGHNGPVTFFGGSTTLPPYCGQVHWTGPTGTMGDAILMNGNSYINIDGGSWDGINIHGYTYVAVYFSGGESFDTISNLEVHDNGSGLQSNGAWYPEFPGIGFYGDSGKVSNLVFNHMNIHDNGEDNFQGDLSVYNLTIENSWMHYTRTQPGVPQESFNLCVHNDGMQIFGTNPSSNLTYENNVFGPGLTNGLIFQPQVNNVTLKNSLLIDPGSNITVENSNAATGWNIDHITAFGQDDNLTLSGSGNMVTNSIFYGGNLLLGGNTVAQATNNCQWQTSGNTNNIAGQTVNPQFVTTLSPYPSQTNNIKAYPTISFLQNANFALQTGSPCKGLGSSITSVAQFLQAATHETSHSS